MASPSATTKYAVDSTGAPGADPAADPTRSGSKWPGSEPVPAPHRPSHDRQAPAGGCHAPGRGAPTAAPAPARASANSALAAAGSASMASSAMPRFIVSATSRTCAPSCRSRSTRRSSTAEASTAAALVAVSSSMKVVSAGSSAFSNGADRHCTAASHGPIPSVMQATPTTNWHSNQARSRQVAGSPSSVVSAAVGPDTLARSWAAQLRLCRRFAAARAPQAHQRRGRGRRGSGACRVLRGRAGGLSRCC